MDEIFFQHGWGFDRHCWLEWQRFLGKGSMAVADRGYLGAPQTPAWEGGKGVAICHSLGLHLLCPRLCAQLRLLVVIGGFVHFHGNTPGEGRLSRRHISRLLALLTKDARQVVNNFYRDCDFPGRLPENANLDEELLTRDLQLLDQSVLDLAPIRQVATVVLLHGSSDRIVPPSRARQLAEALPGAFLVEVEGAGHGLPFSHPEQCWREIEKYIE